MIGLGLDSQKMCDINCTGWGHALASNKRNSLSCIVRTSRGLVVRSLVFLGSRGWVCGHRLSTATPHRYISHTHVSHNKYLFYMYYLPSIETPILNVLQHRNKRYMQNKFNKCVINRYVSCK